MFVRKVSVRLKSDSLKQFTNLMESEVLPWLRMQEGFEDLILLASTEGTEIAALSFWDHKSNADIYDSQLHPRGSEARSHGHCQRTAGARRAGVPMDSSGEAAAGPFRGGSNLLSSS